MQSEYIMRVQVASQKHLIKWITAIKSRIMA